jgi:hypothetical protein
VRGESYPIYNFILNFFNILFFAKKTPKNKASFSIKTTVFVFAKAALKGIVSDVYLLLRNHLPKMQCCGTVTIFYGSGSDF